MYYEVTLRTTEASPTAVVAQTTTWAEFPRLWPLLLDEVYAFVRAGVATQAGHNIMLYKDGKWSAIASGVNNKPIDPYAS